MKRKEIHHNYDTCSSNHVDDTAALRGTHGLFAYGLSRLLLMLGNKLTHT